MLQVLNHLPMKINGSQMLNHLPIKKSLQVLFCLQSVIYSYCNHHHICVAIWSSVNLQCYFLGGLFFGMQQHLLCHLLMMTSVEEQVIKTRLDKNEM
jgi:hypothetical protein